MLGIQGKAYFSLWAATFFWASSFVVFKFAFAYYDPIVVIFGRMLIASLCLAFTLKHLRNTQYRQGDWKRLLFMGICEPGFYFVFESMALERTDASQAGMICAMLPLIVSICAHFLLKEKISRRSLYGFTLAVIGAIILSAAAEATTTAPNPILGNFYEFLAMICATGYMITIKGLANRYNSWFLTMLQSCIGTIFFFPLLFLPSTTIPTEFHLVGALTVVYLGTIVTVGGYGLYNYGMSKISTSQASAFINLIPVFTIFLGWLFLKEQLNWIQYTASALVLFGVFLSQERPGQKTQPKT